MRHILDGGSCIWKASSGPKTADSLKPLHPYLNWREAEKRTSKNHQIPKIHKSKSKITAKKQLHWLERGTREYHLHKLIKLFFLIVLEAPGPISSQQTGLSHMRRWFHCQDVHQHVEESRADISLEKPASNFSTFSSKWRTSGFVQFICNNLFSFCYGGTPQNRPPCVVGPSLDRSVCGDPVHQDSWL